MEERKMERIRNFFKDDSGATMVEFGLMLALIAVACITIVTQLGGTLNTTFTGVDTAVAS
jgi:pilus assembly protein Flp/PilA